MYKRFTLDELKTVQTNFIQNFFSVIRKENCIYPSDFFKKIFKEGEAVYYFNRWDATFRISQDQDTIIITDEKEKIEIRLDETGKKEIQSIIKWYIIKKERVQWQKSIEQILLDEFQKWLYNTILGKSYLVYDIETTSNTNNLKDIKFLLAYAMQPEQNTMNYKYVDPERLKEFVQHMIDFDWYIVGFNHIGFDNPVCIYNLGLSQDEIEILNKKSIDLFLFVQALTGKRISLNKISTALIGLQKTLESGTQVETLLKKYEETGDKKILEEAKKYCKNDVKMTTLVFLYFLHYQKLFVEGEEITFSLDDLIEKSNHAIKEENTPTGWQTSMFA